MDENIYIYAIIRKPKTVEKSSGGYSGSFGQSFRKVSDTLFAPVQVKLV